MAYNNPIISVIMPIFNAENYLREAIDSILGQTFSDFELLILNDGSTDCSMDIISSYNDPRIIIHSTIVNKGLIFQLNKGIELSRGKYIARMDSDDISLPKRFETQFQILENNPEVSVCGTSYFIKDERKNNFKKIIKYERTENPFEVYMHLFFSCAVCHPSVMIRKKLIDVNKLHFDINFKDAEDFELWVRISEISQIINIPNALLIYRLHGNNISLQHDSNQIKLTGSVIKKSFKRVKIELSNNFSFLLAQCIEQPKPGLLTISDFKKIAQVFASLESKYSNSHFKYHIARKMIIIRWFNICLYNNSNFAGFFKTYKLYNKSLFNKYILQALHIYFRSILISIYKKLKV